MCVCVCVCVRERERESTYTYMWRRVVAMMTRAYGLVSLNLCHNGLHMTFVEDWIDSPQVLHRNALVHNHLVATHTHTHTHIQAPTPHTHTHTYIHSYTTGDGGGGAGQNKTATPALRSYCIATLNTGIYTYATRGKEFPASYVHASGQIDRERSLHGDGDAHQTTQPMNVDC